MNKEQLDESSCPISKGSGSITEGEDLNKGAAQRTPFSKFKKVHSDFKLPSQVSEMAKISPGEEIAALERRQEQLDAEIAQLEAEGYKVEELEQHIDKLHEYNDIKDVGQALLGKIAALRGTTTRDLYDHFGLDLDD